MCFAWPTCVFPTKSLRGVLLEGELCCFLPLWNPMCSMCYFARGSSARAPRGSAGCSAGPPRGSAGWSELGHFCQFVQSDTLSVHLCLFPTLSVAPAFWMHFSVSFSLNSAQMLRIIIGLCTFQPIQLVCVLIGPHTHEIINLSWISA